MNYRKEESNIGESSITDLLNKDVANTFTNLQIFHYIPLYIQKRDGISLLLIWKGNNLSHVGVPLNNLESV